MTARALFLQFKSGTRKGYCKNRNSKFNRNSSKSDTSHVLFKFNEAANRTQHILLRNLASQSTVPKRSVMYVFPRITEYNDFCEKIGSLIDYTSFVPVVELDQAASINNVIIQEGTGHKYRTSYDGKISEVNYYFYYYYYNPEIVFQLLAELVCVQIERLLRLLNISDQREYERIISSIRNATSQSINDYNDLFTYSLKSINGHTASTNSLSNYLDLLINGDWKNIPSAPSEFTTKLPIENFKSHLPKSDNISRFNIQIF